MQRQYIMYTSSDNLILGITTACYRDDDLGQL